MRRMLQTKGRLAACFAIDEDVLMTTRVVHVNSQEWKDTPEAERVYIGRPSEWGNPFVIGKDGNREEVIAKHEAKLLRWAREHSGLFREDMLALRGKTLGCFCKAKKPGLKDKPCHGDILARLADMSDAEFEEWLR